MSIIDRIRTIARANINSLLDRADQPEAALQEKIGELEKAISAAKQAAAALAVAYRRMEKEQAHLTDKKDGWQRKAEQAMQSGDEDAARRAIQERIKTEQRIGGLRPGIEKSRATYEEVKRNLVSLHDQLRNARLRLAELASRKQVAEAQRKFSRQIDQATAAALDDTDFSRLEDEVSEAEVTAEIENELRGELGGIGEASAPVDESAVESELDALRQKPDRKE